MTLRNIILNTVQIQAKLNDTMIKDLKHLVNCKKTKTMINKKFRRVVIFG